MENILTVIVLNTDGQPTEGARVSITPSSAVEVTNKAGEVSFKLGDALKYDVTATADGKTVTVPYYVTAGGATRLVVNPVGAYNTTQSMQFIEYRPATVLIHGDTRQPEVSMIRVAENLDVVCGPERLPAHLENLSGDSARVIPLRAAGG